MKEEKEKIAIRNFNDAAKFADESFAKVLVLLNNLGVITDENVRRSFDNRKEICDFLENLVVDYLNEKYSDLHEKISELRKKGNDLTEVSLKLSEFKLKLKLFKANRDKHSFNKAVLILEKVKTGLEGIGLTTSVKKEEANNFGKTAKNFPQKT